ncbi:T9SS type A sorting domain-containing protein [Mangrovibacterium lignilyticum]|uniref:T9SS type A sorting domain-containing protein n=1 Tax=Mangrovibacterium lignilyticum TaxID=2668052 RepID=UPI0013D7A7F9|nr:T9SS type A sorting domain-containing protein [Mangrovibacterium lignilyticum]
MRNAIRIPLLSLFLIGAGQAMGTGLKTLCRLPEKVEETSGIELTGKNEIWTLNDSGGQPELYLCDTLGNLLRTVKIGGAENHDWEDLTQDDQGNFYIGDMGNNNNDRDNLRIYKIPNPGSTSAESIEAEKIKFTYEDQTEFPPDDGNMNFDCEAIIWSNNYLYLFSKNRSFPIKTSVYRIPDEPGEYVAEKIGSFDTGGTSTEETMIYSYWITAADISPNGKQLALLSHDRVWVFYNFSGDNFFGGNYKVYELENSTQKESICFVDNATLYLTDEYWSTFDIGRNLYQITISTPFSTSTTSVSAPARAKFSLSPNPFQNKLKVTGRNLADYQLQLFDQQGKSHQTISPEDQTLVLNTNQLPNGSYFLQFTNRSTGYCWTEKLLKVE